MLCHGIASLRDERTHRRKTKHKTTQQLHEHKERCEHAQVLTAFLPAYLILPVLFLLLLFLLLFLHSHLLHLHLHHLLLTHSSAASSSSPSLST